MQKLYEKMLSAGEKWSALISKGKILRFTAGESGANTALMMYNSKDLAERYNMPDTLKAQHTAFLTTSNILMSDNGRAMTSVIYDSTGWIDTITGLSDKKSTTEKYGETSYQKDSNNYYRNGYENFKVELLRNGLSVRDIMPNLNLFSKISCDEEGNMLFAEKHSDKDDVIMLRTEMDVLLILSNTPNPLDPKTKYPAVPVSLEIYKALPVDITDICVNKCPENKRAFENTWKYYALGE
ncbi:MAG: urea amidolyase associated protein UAAP1 [Endomicrobiaceae bacterium]